MGWGISIGQDDNGHVCCDDANWETFSNDYEDGDFVYPPSSYEFIRDYMDAHHHGEIDMARDEGSAELAHEACCDAFGSAKYSYDDLTDVERTEMHMEWLEKTRKEIANITVDEEATAAARTRIEELNFQIDKLKTELYENQRIIRPAQRKATLEMQIVKELECWE
jgi:hypothetical protein